MLRTVGFERKIKVGASLSDPQKELGKWAVCVHLDLEKICIAHGATFRPIKMRVLCTVTGPEGEVNQHLMVGVWTSAFCVFCLLCLLIFLLPTSYHSSFSSSSLVNDISRQ